MTAGVKRVLWLFAAALALVGAFASGRWWGALGASLEQESRYPWKLHERIGSADLRCERFSPNAGGFMIQHIDDGKTLIVGTLDRASGLATVHAIDNSGKFATDTFPVNCQPQPGASAATPR
jgi:hypothetical protein